MTSGRNAVFVAGQDVTLAGANVAARNVSLDAGRDLVLISQQNVATSNAWSFIVSVTFQGATPTGGSLGGSFSDGSRQYTDTPTTVIADERLDAYAGLSPLACRHDRILLLGRCAKLNQRIPTPSAKAAQARRGGPAGFSPPARLQRPPSVNHKATFCWKNRTK